jgi:outer membrane murein-binding lipoprotein Lpp
LLLVLLLLVAPGVYFAYRWATSHRKKKVDDVQKDVNDLQEKVDELLKKVDAQNQQNQ